MDNGSQLLFATAAFLATHYISSTPLRGVLVRTLGEKAYLALYSLLAFATLGWMIWAYNRAPLEPLWVGLRWLPAVAMPVAFVLAACGLLSRNPTAVGAARLLRNPEPAQGIIRVTRHPLMWGFMLWRRVSMERPRMPRSAPLLMPMVSSMDWKSMPSR